MAGKKENLKALMSNTRSRIIILFTVFLMISLIVIGYFKFKQPFEGSVSGGQVSGGPGSIRSIPGGVNPTAQYALLQETQNIQQATQAVKSGSSAIPTIVRSQAFGDGIEAVGPQQGKAPLGFSSLNRENLIGPQQSLWLQELKNSNCSQSVVQKIVSQGAGLSDLKSVCTCAQLKGNGYALADLRELCSCSQLKEAGYNATQLKGVGYTPERLTQCGYNACELHEAGFSAQQLKDAGLSDGELKGAGYSEQEIARAGGIPADVTEADIQNAGCQLSALKNLREKGVTAAAVRRISGCNIAQLRAAGFSAGQLRAAGYTPAELKLAGFTPAEITQAGYTSAALSQAGLLPAAVNEGEQELTGEQGRDAAIRAAGCDPEKLKALFNQGVSAKRIHELNGCSLAALKAAGYDSAGLLAAGFTPQQLLAAGFSPAAIDEGKKEIAGEQVSYAAIRAAGCDPEKLKTLFNQGVSAKRIHELNGCSLAALKAAGYGSAGLLTAGFTPQQLLTAGFSPAAVNEGKKELAGEQVSYAAIRAAGCDPEKLKTLFNQGVSAKRVHELNGCSLSALKAAGYGSGALLKAGFTPQQLLTAGFTPAAVNEGKKELAGEQVSDADIQAAGCGPEKLKALFNQGVSAKRVHELNGCSLAALKAAGYGTGALLKAGFIPQQLLAAGFTPAAVNEGKEALTGEQVSDAAIRAAGCDPEKLKALFNQGVSAKRVHELNGCSLSALKAAGYGSGALLKAGFTPQQLLAAGFTPAAVEEGKKELAGDQVSNADIRAAGCDPENLKALFNQGVSAERIHELNGCGLAALKAAGFGTGALLNAGFTPQQLLAAGFTPAAINEGKKELSAEQVSDADIRAAGCDPENLKALFNQGVSAKRIHELNGCGLAALKAAGFGSGALLKSGFTPQQLLAAGFTPAAVEEGKRELAGEQVSDADIRAAGCDTEKLKALFNQGVSAERIHELNGCGLPALKAAGFGSGALLKSGFTPQQLLAAGFTSAAVNEGKRELSGEQVSDADIRAAGCGLEKLKALFNAGVSAKRIHELNGCNLAALKAAGYGHSALLKAGFTPQQLSTSGFSTQNATGGEQSIQPNENIANDCSVAKLKSEREAGLSADAIRKQVGCGLAAMKEAGYTVANLKAAGYTAAELKNAGFSPHDLIRAGFTPGELKAAGFNAEQLKNAGVSVNQLRYAGFGASALKKAGINAAQLRAAGFDTSELKNAGFSPQQIKDAGYSRQELADAGIEPKKSALDALEEATLNPQPASAAASIPSLTGPNKQEAAALRNQQQLKEIMQRQRNKMASQQYQQKIQQKVGEMSGAANQALQGWRAGYSQVYIAGTAQAKKSGSEMTTETSGALSSIKGAQLSATNEMTMLPVIKAGEVLFAVLDTSINSDQPGPVLATIVAGRFKGAKLIGSFNMPTNADKMVISFNMMSVPGADKTTAINAYAIDPNTARTALSSRADHHYLLRYGSLFAATFLEGFGNAFQSANTTVTIGGTGVASNTTISNGIGRSTMENAVIGLATLGKNWGQVAMQQMNTPTTVEVFGGIGLGILFTQDVAKV